MPSERRNGPENRRRTLRDVAAAPSTWSAVRSVGNPGGCEGKAGCGGRAGLTVSAGVCAQGKLASSKYTSEVVTIRYPGTSTLKAPGERELRPRLTPTHARESMRDLDRATRGLTAKARQPKGMIPMMAGLSSHDGWFVTRDQFVRGSVASGRSGSSVQDVDGVKDGVVPVTNGRGRRDESGTGEVHDRTYCALGHPV
eukprot:6197786-Pleurochrysis_carterae.AAC.1